jgi:hypothetical protein
MDEQQLSPEKKDRTLIGVLLAGCGCLVVIGVAFGLLAGKFFIFAKAPKDVVQKHLEAVNEEDYGVAYEQLAPEFRARHSMEDFRSHFDAFASLLPYHQVRLNNIRIENDKAYVDGTMTGQDESIFPIHYELKRTGREWKISSFEWIQPGEKQTI